MKNLFCLLILSSISILSSFSQPQTGDEHWKQSTTIPMDKMNFICATNGIGAVFTCFQQSTYPNTYIIYKITPNETKEFCRAKKLEGSGPLKKGIYTLSLFNNELIVAGSFERIDGVLAEGCARWDGEGWKSLGLGIKGMILESIATENEIYFSGIITEAGGQQANGMVSWNGNKWNVLASINCEQLIFNQGGYNIDNYNDHWDIMRYTIRKMKFVGNDIYAIVSVGNQFDKNGTSPQAKELMGKCNIYPGIVKYKINANKWEQVIYSQNPKLISVSDFTVNANVLYFAGLFESGNGQTLSVMKSENNKTKLLVNMPENSNISSLCFSNNNLFVGGSFSNIQSVNASNIAKWDGKNWTTLGSGVSTINDNLSPEKAAFNARMNANKPSEEVVKNLITIENSLIITGNFTKAGGLSSSHVAIWNENSIVQKQGASSLFESATKKESEKDYTGAITDITMAIEQDPKNPDFYIFRGRMYNYLVMDYLNKNEGAYDAINKAENNFNKALELQPSIYDGFYFRGVLGYIIEEYDITRRIGEPYNHDLKPYKDFESASIISPDNPIPYYYLGLLSNLGTFANNNDVPDVTAKYFLTALKYAKDSSLIGYINYNLSLFYFKKQSYTNAIKYSTESIKILSDFFWVHRIRGISKFETNDFDGAILDFDTMIKMYPNEKETAEIYRYRAKSLYKKSGNFELACPDMKKASELGDKEAKKFVDEVCK